MEKESGFINKGTGSERIYKGNGQTAKQARNNV